MKKFNAAQLIRLLANIGVIAGIVFLGFELGQNNRLLISQSEYSLLQTRLDNYDAVFRDPEIAELLVRARTNPSELSEADETRLFARSMSYFINYEFHFSQIRAGNLRDEESFTEAIRTTFANPAVVGIPEELFLGVWGAIRGQMRPDFVSYVEESVIDSSRRP